MASGVRTFAFRAALAGVAVVALVMSILWMDYRRFLDAPVGGGTHVVVVESGQGWNDVVEMLEREGLIDAPNYLRYYLWRASLGGQLKAGAYRIEPEMSARDVVALMIAGDTTGAVVLRVPEGMNLYDLAAKMDAKGLASAKDVIKRATDPVFAASLGVPADRLEGYLFPATYEIVPGTPVDDILRRMHERFKTSWRRVTTQHADAMRRLKRDFGLDDHELLTLASLVEKEAAVAKERAVIARVFYNRLKQNMRLQTDPTCVYPPLSRGEKPSPKRCRDRNNRYSTYVIKGLPPGPISGVGEASLRAVLKPYRGPDAQHYLFFVARHDGSHSHYFSAALDEHQQAIDFFLKKIVKSPPRGTRQP